MIIYEYGSEFRCYSDLGASLVTGVFPGVKFGHLGKFCVWSMMKENHVGLWSKHELMSIWGKVNHGTNLVVW